MVKRKKIKEYFEKQCDGLINDLLNLENNIDADIIHDLRLHAKKIRSVASFLKECQDNNKKFSTKKLKDLFHNAGEIRTAQLNLETLNHLNIQNEAFIKDQSGIIENDSKTLVDKGKKHNRDIGKLKKSISGNLRDIKNNSVIAWYYINIKRLSDNFKVIDENNLHDSRKIIKRLLYTLKILPASLLLKLNLNVNYLDSIQELIGTWHDSVVTLEILSKAGIADGEGFSELIRKKQDQLEIIVRETRSFDADVMFATKLK